VRLVFKRTGAAQPPLPQRAFDLMCLSVAVLLALHAPHLPYGLTAGLGFVLAWRWWQRRQRAGRTPTWLKLPLLGLLTLAVIGSYGTLFGLEPGAAFAVGLLVLKLLESETVRDARVAMGFACFALMSALLFGQGLVATFVVALGLLPTLAALRALEPAQRPVRFIRELLPGVGLLLCALPLALFAFLVVPRLGSPLWGAPSSQQATSGLSDSMSPGNFTDLLLDDSPALRVNFEGMLPPTNQRYFRAYVMWDYDGRSWEHVDARLRPTVAVEADAAPVAYQINLEPTHQRVLPALDVPLEAPAHAQLRGDRELIADRPVNDPFNYSLRSVLRYQLQPTLDERSRQRGLRLPAGFNPRTQALAAEWRQQHGGDDAAIVQAALTLFHDRDFHYTLSPPRLGRDAMDEFLFVTRQGFCEHYASSFTVLMRAAGIPARVVTGYQGGYWNALGGYLLVRQSDAHAWSEVWLAGRGWVRVDPTAAVRPERISLGANAAAFGQLPWYRSGWLQDMRNHWDIVNQWWNEGVIGFDSIRQRGLLTPFGLRDLDDRMLGVILAAGSALFALLGLGWALHRRERIDPASRLMRALENKLGRGGIVRRANEGPQHYLSRAARALPAQRDELMKLMNCYLECRYAHDEPPPESLRYLRRLVRDFRVRRVFK